MNYLRLLQLRRAAGDSPAGNAGGAPAEDAGAQDTQQTGAPDSATAPEKEPTDKTFTQADIDRIVQQTIAKERKRAEAAMATARSEAQRLATMTAEQRAEEARKAHEADLAKRERELTRRELRAQALETLSGKGLPHELADALSYADADACNASIAAVEKAYRAAVQKGVEERMKGQPPKSGNNDPGAALMAQMRAAAGLK